MSEIPKPQSEVPAVSAQTLALSELELEPARAADAPVRPPLLKGAGDLVRALRNVKIMVTVCVGSAELTVEDLLSAKAQQVVRLDRAVEQPVDLLVEGQVVARGILIAVEDRFGVRITEMPVASADVVPSPRGPEHGGQPR